MPQGTQFLIKVIDFQLIFVLKFTKSNNLKVISRKNSVRTAFLPDSNAIIIYNRSYPIIISRL